MYHFQCSDRGAYRLYVQPVPRVRACAPVWGVQYGYSKYCTGTGTNVHTAAAQTLPHQSPSSSTVDNNNNNTTINEQEYSTDSAPLATDVDTHNNSSSNSTETMINDTVTEITTSNSKVWIGFFVKVWYAILWRSILNYSSEKTRMYCYWTIQSGFDSNCQIKVLSFHLYDAHLKLANNEL